MIRGKSIETAKEIFDFIDFGLRISGRLEERFIDCGAVPLVPPKVGYTAKERRNREDGRLSPCWTDARRILAGLFFRFQEPAESAARSNWHALCSYFAE